MKKLFTLFCFLLFSAPAMAAFQLSNYTAPATGIAIPYWVISQVTLNSLQNTINVKTSGYVNSAAYVAGLQPATVQNFIINGATYTTFLAALTSVDMPVGTPQSSVVAEIMGILQTNMLTLPFFSTATIVP